MAKKKDKTSDGEAKPKKKKSILKKLLLVLVILGLLAGTGFFVWDRLFAEKPGVVPESQLDREILEFTFEKMPEVHTGIRSLGQEITFTKQEIERIGKIEQQFPDQAKITGSEKKLWEKNLTDLTKFRVKHEKEVRDIYVSFRVNDEKGLALIDERKEALVKSSEEILKVSQTLTEKIRKAEEAKDFITKLKEKVFKS